MQKAFFAALAATVVVAASWPGTAEARCVRVGHHWSCTPHRAQYAQRPHYRSFAAAYRYGYDYPSYYAGGGYPYSGSSSSGASFGPRASSAGGP